MALPTWTARLMQSIEANKPQPLFFTLSTLAPDGSPRSRTVVCRRVVPDGDSGRLVICTSTDSDKWAELSRDPRFEICWYFATSREQYRLRGSAIECFTLPHAAAQAVWNSMSDSARAMFYNASTKKIESFGVISFRPSFIQLLELTSGTTTNWQAE